MRCLVKSESQINEYFYSISTSHKLHGKYLHSKYIQFTCDSNLTEHPECFGFLLFFLLNLATPSARDSLAGFGLGSKH